MILFCWKVKPNCPPEWWPIYETREVGERREKALRSITYRDTIDKLFDEDDLPPVFSTGPSLVIHFIPEPST